MKKCGALNADKKNTKSIRVQGMKNGDLRRWKIPQDQAIASASVIITCMKEARGTT